MRTKTPSGSEEGRNSGFASREDSRFASSRASTAIIVGFAPRDDCASSARRLFRNPASSAAVAGKEE
jgi:hypothetical protein